MPRRFGVAAVLAMRTAKPAARRGTFQAVRDRLRETVQRHSGDLAGDRARRRAYRRAVRFIGSLRGGLVGALWRLAVRFRL